MIEHPIPLIEVDPNHLVLGRFLGRIEFSDCTWRCAPLCNLGGHVLGLSDLPSFPQFPDYGLIERKGNISQFVLQAMTDDLYVPEPLHEQIFVELHNCQSRAIMAISGIACRALVLALERPTGSVRIANTRGEKIPFWGPIEVVDQRDPHVVPIYITTAVSDEVTAGQWAEKILRHRDYARNQLEKAMAGIMGSNIRDATKW